MHTKFSSQINILQILSIGNLYLQPTWELKFKAEDLNTLTNEVATFSLACSGYIYGITVVCVTIYGVDLVLRNNFKGKLDRYKQNR